jgi:hypothetical protein
VAIETFTNPVGEKSVFVPQDHSVAALCTAFNLAPATTKGENSFNTVLEIVLSDWRIFRILRELIEAITLPHESAVNCARAIEGLRHYVSPAGAPRNQTWAILRDGLKLTEPYLKMITEVSTAPRHGDPVHIPGSTTTEIVRRTWTIMNRFFEYKKRGGSSLPESDFPWL